MFELSLLLLMVVFNKKWKSVLLSPHTILHSRLAVWASLHNSPKHIMECIGVSHGEECGWGSIFIIQYCVPHWTTYYPPRNGPPSLLDQRQAHQNKKAKQLSYIYIFNSIIFEEHFLQTCLSNFYVHSEMCDMHYSDSQITVFFGYATW